MSSENIAGLRFLKDEQVRDLASKHKTPFYVYSRAELQRAVNDVLGFRDLMPYGCTPRYATKANEHPDILKFFDAQGLSFDASSGFEAENIVKLGIDPHKILLTAQQLPDDLAALVNQGVNFTATSLHQLKTFCEIFPGKPVNIRINPGMGHGHNNRNITGGLSASFGIWYEYIPEALDIIKAHGSELERLHMHIGSGSDPVQWVTAVKICLEIVEKLPGVKILNIGGGFKTAYMPGDKETNMSAVGAEVGELIKDFAAKTGRKLHIEIEPGRFLVVHAGSIISKVIDITDTGKDGYKFIRTNTGMTEIQRQAMYGAQHQLVVVAAGSETVDVHEDYIVVGHCCESSDCLTVVKGDPEQIEPRTLQKANIGDYLVVEAAGAYCASMPAAGFNGFPKAPEILID